MSRLYILPYSVTIVAIGVVLLRINRLRHRFRAVSARGLAVSANGYNLLREVFVVHY